MPAFASRVDRKTQLETLTRQALATGSLSLRATAALTDICTQPDLTAEEARILEILQDALGQGHIQRV